jgi:DedD protein
MDRRVKERLIGASILVAFVVLVVPELLSGPKPTTAPAPILPAAAPAPTHSIEVDLATSKAPANAETDPAAPENPTSGPASSAASTPAPESSAPSGPAPAAPTSMGTSPAAGPASSGAAKSASARPAARPAPVESSASSPITAAHGSWSVQLGSFANRANAENLTRQLKDQGFAVFVLPGGSGSSVRYRVRVGPLANRESAERMAAKLKSQGHVGSLVSPTCP